MNDEKEGETSNLDKKELSHGTDLSNGSEDGVDETDRGIEYLKSRIEELTLKIKSDPDSRSFFVRAETYYDLEQYEKAVDDYSEAIRLNPKYSVAFHNRGYTYDKLGNYEKAVEDYSEAIRLNPKYSVAFHNRGYTYEKLGQYEKALVDLNEAIRLNPKLFNAFSNRGRVYFLLNQNERAKQDLLTSISLNPSHQFALCHLGELFVKLGEVSRGMDFYKEAVEKNAKSPTVYRLRSRALSSIDEERAIEDYFRWVELKKKKIDEGSKTEIPKIEEIYNRLKKNIEREIIWLPFTEDKCEDEEIEKNEISKLKELVKNSKDISTNLQLYRFLGGGAFAWTFLCRIIGVNNIFVIKIIKPDKDSVKEKEKDCVPIPYHRNVVMTLSNFERSIKVDCQVLKKLFGSFLDDRPGIRNQLNGKSINTPLIMMKYHRKTLSEYIEQRKKDRLSFTTLELCCILRGLLRGVKHLYDHKIVHRDLHSLNVFVDPPFGRIFIGDFGCSLDLRNNPTGFKVEMKDYFYPSLYYCTNSKTLGGNKNSLAPEVIDSYDAKGTIVDYSKNDLFSVGVLGYSLISSFVGNGKCAPFGYNDPPKCANVIYEGRKQKKYVDLATLENLELDSDSPRLEFYELIGELLKVDPKERIGYEEAVQKIEELTSLASKTEKKKSNEKKEDEFVNNPEETEGEETT